MKDKVAIVTGGAQGIGRAITERFLREGMAVVIADTDDEAGRETQAELSASGRILFAPTDVSDEEQVVAMVAETVKAFGRIDVLVNNAATSRGKPLTDLTREEWDRVIAVNLTGPFLCAKHAAPHLRKHGGAIVNIASTRALMSEANTEAYSASKGGLVALTHALAVSLGPEVRVNCISPGWIETGDWKKRSKRREPEHSDADRLQHPAGRVGKPEDIAEMVFHLASDKGGFITGANFVIDGGMTRKMIYVE
ncbi:glucose 1-dehydrogenase [Candidatus Sumerlaeota bacterium]|nr:glucose 1-dehydrogenase [Candidatus Sumerlaeota bacterium]